MTKEEIQVMANKIGEVAPQLAAQFIANPDNFDYSQLEHYSKFTDKYKNVADFTGDKAGIKANIWQQLEGKFPSDARFQSLQQEYPWLNKEELKDWFDKTNAYKAEYEAEREAAAAKKKREQEVKDWGWRDFVASDYEKQRYVDDPNAALFGEQAPVLGDAPETRWGAIGDLATGVAAGAADVTPLPFGAQIWAGPAIRAARDIGHKVSDSPYQKDVTTIGGDIAKDISFNLGAAFLANARRGARIASMARDPKVGDALALADETKNINEGIKRVAEYAEWPKNVADVKYMHTDAELFNAVKAMPESELKSELMPLVSDFTNKPINRAAVNELFAKYGMQANPTVGKVNKKLVQQNELPLEFEGNNAFYTKTIASPTYEDLSKLEKAQYQAVKLTNAINAGKLGQSAFEGYNTAVIGRGSQPNIVETALRQKEKEDTINRLISSYSLLWNKKNPPPEAKDSPLIKAAWEKWSKE